jgi:phosphoenolpyruvate synthase/pyruvate phosphate dikinase
MDLIAPLRRFSRGDLSVAGGKGANLGELIRAGFPVPPGFLLTTGAYDLFVTANGLAQAIAGAHGNRQGGEVVRQAFRRASIPPEVELALLAAYDRLGRGPVAATLRAAGRPTPCGSAAWSKRGPWRRAICKGWTGAAFW